MKKTLEQNGIDDQSERYEDLEILDEEK